MNIYATDAVVIPSRSEGQGIVVLEAMALKTALIVADRGGIPEMVRHEQEALLFNVDCIDELSESICRVLGKQREAADQISKASKRYWSEYSQPYYQRRWKAVLDQMDGHK